MRKTGRARRRVSTQTPALAAVAPTKFAMAVACVDGAVVHTGDSDEAFSIQSLSKLFALCVLLPHDRTAWSEVGWATTNAGYGSVADLEHNHGRPPNPFVNAGAVVVTDRLITHTGDATAATIDRLRSADPNATIASEIDVAISESLSAHRNSAIAHVLAELGYLNHPIDEVLRQYFAQCAITASFRTLAKAALFLADRTGSDMVLDEPTVRKINAVLLTSGMYGAAGDIAFASGCPPRAASAAASGPPGARQGHRLCLEPSPRRRREFDGRRRRHRGVRATGPLVGVLRRHLPMHCECYGPTASSRFNRA